MDIEKLNSYYVPPQELFSVIHCFYDPQRPKPRYLGSRNSWVEILNRNENFQEALKLYEKARICQYDDEIALDFGAVAARASALMRFIADMAVDHLINRTPDDMDAAVGGYWPRRDFIFAASFTPLRLYESANENPFFAPVEFMSNLDLVRKTMGPILAKLTWGASPSGA